MVLRPDMCVPKRAVERPVLRFILVSCAHIMAGRPLGTQRVSEVGEQTTAMAPRRTVTAIDNEPQHSRAAWP